MLQHPMMNADFLASRMCGYWSWARAVARRTMPMIAAEREERSRVRNGRRREKNVKGRGMHTGAED